MELNLITGHSKHPNIEINPAECINWYPLIASKQDQNRDQIILKQAPGLYNIGGGVTGNFAVRAQYATETRSFAVVNRTLYETTFHPFTAIGSLTNFPDPNNRVWMELNGNNEMIIANGDSGYCYDLDTNILTEITDVDFPGCDYMTYGDGYVAVVRNGEVHYSALNDVFSWSGLDFFNTTSKKDRAVAVAIFKEELYIFSSKSIEIYINDGSSPFTRLSRSSINTGGLAGHSVAVCEKGVFFVGMNKAVYMIDNSYQMQPLSTKNIASFLNEVQDISDAEGMIEYNRHGDIFYYLTIPDIDKTFVYDTGTTMWHQRESKKPFDGYSGESLYGSFRGNNIIHFRGRTLVGDKYSGNIFEARSSYYQDNGDVLRRVLRSSTQHQKGARISVGAIEFDINSGNGITTGQGSDPIMMFRYSTDGGYTYSDEYHLSTGAIGNRDTQVKVGGLGTGKYWVTELVMTDPVLCDIMGAIANVTVGSDD